MTLAFILICFITNMLWFLYFLEMKNENQKLEKYATERWDYYYRGIKEEKEVIKNHFLVAQTPDSFCDWVYNSFFNNVEKVEND